MKKEKYINNSDIVESEKELLKFNIFNFNKIINRNTDAKLNKKIHISISFLLFILSYYLYYLSLEKCLEGFDICGTKNDWINTKLSEAVLSSFILAALIECMIYNFIPKLNIIHIIIYYIFIYKYSHGLDFVDHGFYNFFGHISIVFLLIILFIPLNGLLYFIKKKNKIVLFFYITILLFFIIICYFIFFVHYMNCDKWPIGLNNTIIENSLDKYSCNIKFPKICPYELGKYIFDFSKFKGVECNKTKENTKLKLLRYNRNRYINKKTKKIGFPLLNKDKEVFLSFKARNNKISQFTKKNLVDMENQEMVKKIFKENMPEIVIDYNNNPYGELIINLNFNETLSAQRKILEKNSNPYSDNIMVIYIDSVSRANSMRKLKKTLKFIEQFMSYKGGFNPKYPSENYHSFQFFKYHSFSFGTRNNFMQLFYGYSYGSIDVQKIIRISKYFKENGYVTSFINDMCLREPTNTGHQMSQAEIGDHEMLICDPNMKSVYSHTKRCLYNKISTEIVYEYGNQFWRKYKNNRKFLTAMTNDGHEGTLEVIKYIDDILFDFLNKLYKDNLFKDTTIFLMSDHGAACPSPYYMTEFYQIEKRLPMLYIICNDRKNISYYQQYEYINNNQQILITGYDIYNTFGHLMYGDKYSLIQNKTQEKDSPKTKLGISLFNKINPKKRTPKNYEKMDVNVCI